MNRYLILILIIGICTASNYITNGDFEQPLATGWTQYSSNAYGGIMRGSGYHPDPDYEAYVYRIGQYSSAGGYEKLYQTVDIPLIDIDFSVSLKLYAWDNGSSWCGAACVLSYLDDSDVVLGKTRICYESPGCPWSNSPTQHLIAVYDSSWHDYTFNINDELQNLSGVNPLNVAKITVTLMDTAYCC